MFQGCNGQVCDTRSLQSRYSLLPSFVCWLGCLLNMECAEIGGGGCLDDLRETRLQDLLKEKARPDSVSDHTLDARFGCDESSQMCRSSDVSRSFKPNSGLACTEGCLCRAVLREGGVRETAARSRRRPLRHFVLPRLCGREPAGGG